MATNLKTLSKKMHSLPTIARQYIPKGTDFSEVTDKHIRWIENQLNNRPRKKLGYLTPNEKVKQIINQDTEK